MSRRFSIIVVPGEDSRVRHFRIRSGIMEFLFCCCFIVAGLLAFFSYSYFNDTIDRDELQRLRVVTSQQRQAVQRLAMDLGEVHLQMSSLAETEARVRQLAALETTPEGIPIAIGGLPEVRSADTVDEIQRQINKLQVDIELRRQSQQDVRNLLNEKVSLSRATPKG